MSCFTDYLHKLGSIVNGASPSAFKIVIRQLYIYIYIDARYNMIQHAIENGIKLIVSTLKMFLFCTYLYVVLYMPGEEKKELIQVALIANVNS